MTSGGLADGLLLVDKPAGPTSHDVVEAVRRAHNCKAGHSGTLDPFATGLLVVLVGRATREQEALTALSKQYDATAHFGVRSDTGDPEGNLEPTGRQTTASEVEAKLPLLRGTIEQRVPMASAVKVGGERLYRKARRGEIVETPVRSVRVEALNLRSFAGQRAELAVECSKGTYVRQLVADLGELVGAGAYCERLRRTAVGPFSVDRAIPLDRVDAASDLGELPAWLPMRILFGDLEVGR